MPDLRRSACLPPAQRATSSTPSKREPFDQVIFCLSNKLRRTRRGAHCAPAFCAEFAFCSIIVATSRNSSILSFAERAILPPFGGRIAFCLQSAAHRAFFVAALYTNSQLKCLTERIRFFVLTKPSEVRRTGGTLNGTRQSQSEKDGARIKPF